MDYYYPKSQDYVLEVERAVASEKLASDELEAVYERYDATINSRNIAQEALDHENDAFNRAIDFERAIRKEKRDATSEKAALTREEARRELEAIYELTEINDIYERIMKAVGEKNIAQKAVDREKIAVSKAVDLERAARKRTALAKQIVIEKSAAEKAAALYTSLNTKLDSIEDKFFPIRERYYTAITNALTESGLNREKSAFDKAKSNEEVAREARRAADRRYRANKTSLAEKAAVERATLLEKAAEAETDNANKRLYAAKEKYDALVRTIDAELGFNYEKSIYDKSLEALLSAQRVYWTANRRAKATEKSYLEASRPVPISYAAKYITYKNKYLKLKQIYNL